MYSGQINGPKLAAKTTGLKSGRSRSVNTCSGMGCDRWQNQIRFQRLVHRLYQNSLNGASAAGPPLRSCAAAARRDRGACGHDASVVVPPPLTQTRLHPVNLALAPENLTRHHLHQIAATEADQK